jgi:acetyltransferase
MPIKTELIEALFRPRNVVLVGASDRTTDHWSRRVWENLHRFNYRGTVLPLNPNRSEIWGNRCFRDFASLPEPPDHLVICTPAEVALENLREGAAAGARAATLFAAGFGEGGDPQGLALAARLRRIIEETQLTIVGPNCMGVACGDSGFCSIPDETLQELGQSPIAIVAQSGAMCTSLNRALNELDLKVSYFASCGGQIGATAGEFIEYFAARPELRLILCYLEGIPDPLQFFAAARLAREHAKVVVAVKIGASASARAFALAHTGALAGSAEVFEAFAAAAGVARFDSIEDAIEASAYLARCPLPRGGNIAVMTSSGALRNLIAEAAERAGVALPSLTEATSRALREILAQSDITNPLDTKRTVSAVQYAACLDALAGAPEIDIVLTAEELPRDDGAPRRVSNLCAVEGVAQRAASAGKAVAVFTPFITSTTAYGREIRAKIPHVPVMRDIERSLRVLRVLTHAATSPPWSRPLFGEAVDNELTRPWRARAATLEGATALNEIESKTLLRAYGISAPPEQVVKSADEAVAAAKRIGFPVVLKAVSAAVAHKSDAGLVILDVGDPAAVERGVAMLVGRAEALRVPLDAILVAKAMSDGIETVLGLSRDAEMGPVVMFGLGGIMVELFKDVSFAPPTLDSDAARAMIERTRAARLIEGFRGKGGGDREALVSALVNLGRLACELSDVIEAIDVNPFLVGARGAYALDALVVLRPPQVRPPFPAIVQGWLRS